MSHIDPFSTNQAEKLTTAHHLRHLSAHNRLNLLLLIFSFILTSTAGFLILYPPQLPQISLPSFSSSPAVLGEFDFVSTDQTLVPTPDYQSWCFAFGGKIQDLGLNTSCVLQDGSSCLLDQLTANGCPQPIPTASPQIVTSVTLTPTPTPARYISYLKLSLIDPKLTPIESDLASLVIRLLTLPPGSLQNIAFDTRSSEPYSQSKYNQSYYLITRTPIPATSSRDYAVVFDVNPAPQNLLPFLTDSLYCESAQDCQIRTNFCQYAAFNPYHPFVDSFACKGYTDAFAGSRLVYDEVQSCKALTYYDEPQCIENQCIPTREARLCQP